MGTVSEPIDDIISWSASQQPWRRDCLRRLAITNELTEADRRAHLRLAEPMSPPVERLGEIHRQR